MDFTEWVRVDDIISGEVTEETTEGAKNGVEEKRKEVADNGGGQLSDKRNVYCKHNVVAGDSDPCSDANDHRELVAKPAEKVEKGDEGDNARLSNKRNTDRKHSGGAGDSSIGSDDDNRQRHRYVYD